MGDSTASDEGYLTLNPIAHTNVYGLLIGLIVCLGVGAVLPGFIPRRTLIFFLLFILGMYWAYQTPIDDRNFTRYRLGGILTSLAGPLGTLVLAFLALVLVKYLPYQLMPNYAVITCISFLKDLNDIAIWFTILELTPIPPFDGGDVLYYILPTSQQEALNWFYEYSVYIVMVLYLAPFISDVYFGTIALMSSYLKQLMLIILF